MRENEFEKRVQEKMSEFRLSPSGEVWQEVERRIRKEKKRRFIFWWPLFFLLAGGGITAVILLTNKKNKQEPTSQINQPDNTKTKPGNEFNPPVQVTQPTHSADPKQPTNHPTTNESNSYANKTNTRIATNGKVMITSYPPKRNKATGIKENKQENREETPVIVETTSETADQPAKPGRIEPVPAKQADPLKEPVINNEMAVQEKSNEPSTIAQPAKTETRSSDSIANTTTKKAAAKKNNKWDWGFSAGAGRSTIVNGFRIFNGSLYADATTLPTGASSGPGGTVAYPPRIQPAFSWSAGFFRETALSEKVRVRIGLGYTYLSNRIQVGNRVDSARNIYLSNSPGLTVNNFYRSAGTTGYTNRYHFLSVTGDFSWRIVNGNSFKLYWENGIGFSRLLGSSMLHYNWSLPGYYKNNQLLTKNNLFYSMGLSVPAGQRWVINPFASYSLTRVVKNDDSSRTHYSNFGIRIRYLLKKK